MPNCHGPQCGRIHRRAFLGDMGMGFAGLALGAMLHQDGFAAPAAPPGQPHFPPRAKSIIWIFLSGGYSQLETFDPKPALNRYAGKTYNETPYSDPREHPHFLARSRSVVGFDREVYPKIYPLQVGFRRHGQCGLDVSDWLPHLATCADDLAVVRSMYTTDNDHGAEFQMHTGRHVLDTQQPVLGSWIHYGLGTLNENLPKFIFLGQYGDTRVRRNFDADYLGPEHAGIELNPGGQSSLPFAQRGRGVLPQEQQNQFEFVNELNRLSAVQYPEDERLRARIRSYELAFRMQMSVPEALDLSRETPQTHALYGIDNGTTAAYGRRLLAARRLAERGVRFTLVYLSDYGEWDSHQRLRENHARSCARIDKPVAGLLKDLKRRGLWDDVQVVFCTEFGRTPGLEERSGGTTGRDHHPHGFTVWLAGAGIKSGVVHGTTDELGFHAAEHPHYVTDLHATVLHSLGLDARRLDVPGRQRLEMDYGEPIREIMR